MSDLTEAQKIALKYSKYHGFDGCYYCDYFYQEVPMKTLKALERKGYVERGGVQFWLTDKGESVRKDLHDE